jgi:hypothetical protein
MSEPVIHELEPSARKAPRFRWWVIMIILACAAAAGWWGLSAIEKSEATRDPFAQSLKDGRCRFWEGKYSVMTLTAPPNSSLLQRLDIAWINFQLKHGKKNPAAHSFPASPTLLCSIQGLLSQCMEVTGTRYLVAVEIGGGIEFGHTNVLSGPQWVAAFERAIAKSTNVLCYDYSTRRNFQDSLLLIRERPGLVKIVPRSKLADYQKAGLVSGKASAGN